MNEDASIAVAKLSKHFKVPVRQAGLRAGLVSLFHRQHSTIKAVDAISFSIQPGGIVGFLVPTELGKQPPSKS